MVIEKTRTYNSNHNKLIQITGGKENHFYSLPFGQAEDSNIITSPNVLSTSPKSFLTGRIDFTVLLPFEFLKKHYLPVGQVKNRIH